MGLENFASSLTFWAWAAIIGGLALLVFGGWWLTREDRAKKRAIEATAKPVMGDGMPRTSRERWREPGR